MNTAKNSNSHTLLFRLVVPTSILFIFFVFVLTTVAYNLFSSSVSDLTINEIKKSSQQTITNYETYFDSVTTVANNVQVKVDSIDIKNDENKELIANYFNDLMSIKAEINDMAIYDSNAELIVANANYKPINASVNDAWFKKANEDQLIDIFSRVDRDEGTYTYSFTLSKHITYKDGIDSGILKIDFDFTKVITLISETDFGEGGHMTIYDDDYSVVYSSLENVGVDPKETEFVKSLVMGVNNYSSNGHTYTLYTSTITGTRWRVALFTNVDSLTNIINYFLIIIISAALVASLLFVLIMMAVSNSVIRPIKQLQDEMVKVQNFNYVVDYQKNIHGSREVEELSNSFNQMMERINQLMKNVIKEQEEQKKSELKALQNQINPHFLYNTFDSIIYMIENGENEKAEEMIVALSKFFRISVSKGHNIIPLLFEIDHAKYYLQIQKMRFGNSFTYDFDIEKGLEKYYVIKLILQPLIENAISHGISGVSGIGKITIKAYTTDKFLCLSVIDNGFGILPEKIKEIYNSFKDDSIKMGVGIKNIYQRIKIYYGNEADIKIESELDKGTTATIIIPLKGAINNNEK